MTTLLVVIASLHSAFAASVPDFVFRSDGVPMWVASSVAFNHDGNMRSDLFPEYTRKRIDAMRFKNQIDCVTFALSPPAEIFTSMGSLDALITNARAIVVGEVVSQREGFYADTPGTMFAVRVARNLKQLDHEPAAADALFFVSSARMDTPKGLVCAKPLDGVVVPAVGDRVMFFSYLNPMDSEKRIHHLDPQRQLIIETTRGLTIPPAVANGTDARTLDDLIEVVRSKTKPSSAMVR